MNINGSHNKAPTLTKRKRKQATAIVKANIQMGDTVELSDRVYRGRNPVYTATKALSGAVKWIKTQIGVPFVRVADIDQTAVAGDA